MEQQTSTNKLQPTQCEKFSVEMELRYNRDELMQQLITASSIEEIVSMMDKLEVCVGYYYACAFTEYDDPEKVSNQLKRHLSISLKKQLITNGELMYLHEHAVKYASRIIHNENNETYEKNLYKPLPNEPIWIRLLSEVRSKTASLKAEALKLKKANESNVEKYKATCSKDQYEAGLKFYKETFDRKIPGDILQSFITHLGEHRVKEIVGEGV